MKKITVVLIFVLSILAVFTGCKDTVVEYKDPFNGKAFYQNMGSTAEKSLSFKNGELTISYWEEFLSLGGKTSGECTYTETTVATIPSTGEEIKSKILTPELTEWRKTVSAVYSYTFDGEKKKLVITPKKVFLPKMQTICMKDKAGVSNTLIWEVQDSTKDYTDWEEDYAPISGALLNYDEYLAQLNIQSPDPEGDNTNEMIAKIVFQPVTYDYTFSAIFGIDSPYRLTLVSEDDTFFKVFVLTSVFSN